MQQCVFLEFQNTSPRSSQQNHLNKTIYVWLWLSSIISYAEKQCKSKKLWLPLVLTIARELFWDFFYIALFSEVSPWNSCAFVMKFSYLDS